MRIKSICLVGVDGTGKSSMVEKLQEYYGKERAVVQYMGSRLWETPIAKKYLDGGRKGGSPFNKLMGILSLLYEMNYRVNKHRREKRIVIFDRYVDEKVLSFKSKKGGLNHKLILVLYTIFFKVFFYRPKITFYLTCPIEVSFQRKSDIVTDYEKQKLLRTKQILDNYYINRSDVVTIDSYKQNQEEVFNTILMELKKWGF